MEFKRDSRLGRYIIRGRIGQGGMGVVYRAYDGQLQRYVAIKTIQGDKASDQEFLSRFKREALAVSQIDHPHIVRLIDFVDAVDDQPSYMVMELLEGKNLDQVMKEVGPLGLSRIVDRILESIAAVGECHRRGFIHRDIKPSNIFLAEYNQIETAKVLDFGTVKQEEQQERPGEDTELTKKGFFLGTPEYMSPEQLTGKPATPKSDQYSLAVVLYTAASGHKPFQAHMGKEFKGWDLLHAMKEGDYTPVQKLRPDVPTGLADAIHKAMNFDPAKRFSDLHGFGAALRPFASPQAKLTWEAFFTSRPPSRREPQLSIAIMADGAPRPAAALDGPTNVDPIDRTFPPFHGTGPTVAVRGERHQTIPISTAELKVVSGENSLATTSRRPSEFPSASISIAIEEASQSAKSLPSDVPAKRPDSETTAKSLLRTRPVQIVIGAGVLFAVVLGAAFFITHRTAPAASASTRPPVEMFAKTVAPPPAAPPATPPAAVVAPPVPPPPAPADLPAAPTASRPAAQTAPEVRHHQHKKPKPQTLDSHGIPIPTD